MAALPKGQRVVVTELGEDPLEAIEKHTQLVEMAAPDPAQLGPRDVLIAVKSASVGWVDLLMTSGQYQHLAKPPYTPGLESAGLIVHKGPEVPELLRVGLSVGSALPMLLATRASLRFGLPFLLLQIGWVLAWSSGS